jgi:hypothetical protein
VREDGQREVGAVGAVGTAVVQRAEESGPTGATRNPRVRDGESQMQSGARKQASAKALYWRRPAIHPPPVRPSAAVSPGHRAMPSNASSRHNSPVAVEAGRHASMHAACTPVGTHVAGPSVLMPPPSAHCPLPAARRPQCARPVQLQPGRSSRRAGVLDPDMQRLNSPPLTCSHAAKSQQTTGPLRQTANSPSAVAIALARPARGSLVPPCRERPRADLKRQAMWTLLPFHVRKSQSACVRACVRARTHTPLATATATATAAASHKTHRLWQRAALRCNRKVPFPSYRAPRRQQERHAIAGCGSVRLVRYREVGRRRGRCCNRPSLHHTVPSPDTHAHVQATPSRTCTSQRRSRHLIQPLHI